MLVTLLLREAKLVAFLPKGDSSINHGPFPMFEKAGGFSIPPFMQNAEISLFTYPGVVLKNGVFRNEVINPAPNCCPGRNMPCLLQCQT